ERSERLLLNVLPKEIAPRLKAGENPIADAYEHATVLYADIVGSTMLAERLDAKELVALLNGIFSRFDLLAERHGVEKIRTIGDNYMCVAGVPRQRADHAQAMARMALGIRAYLDELRAAGEDRIDFRIGMNSGPCVGGVIGLRKFVFDIWGDSVNTASRMESHSVPGRIHLTDAAADSSGANDPYCTAPARWYVAMITPVFDVLTSTPVKAAGTVPSAKRRFPLPSAIGKTMRWNSSTRSYFMSVWMSCPLP